MNKSTEKRSLDPRRWKFVLTCSVGNEYLELTSIIFFDSKTTQNSCGRTQLFGVVTSKICKSSKITDDD